MPVIVVVAAAPVVAVVPVVELDGLTPCRHLQGQRCHNQGQKNKSGIFCHFSAVSMKNLRQNVIKLFKGHNNFLIALS